MSSKSSGTSTTFYVRDNRGKLLYEQVPSGAKYYYLSDALGTVTGLVNSSGGLVGGTAYTYDPYGTMTGGQTSVDNPWLFQGQYSVFEDQGSTFGLNHMGARYYQPGIERWTQQDPQGITIGGESPLDQNLYLFAADNPINRTDPTGQQSSCLNGHDLDLNCIFWCVLIYTESTACAMWCVNCLSSPSVLNTNCWACYICAAPILAQCYEECG